MKNLLDNGALLALGMAGVAAVAGRVVSGSFSHSGSRTVLDRLAPGHYKTEDGLYSIRKDTGRSWSGDRGAYGWTHWTASAVGREDLLAAGHPWIEVARGRTLEEVKRRLDRYIGDLESGSLGARSRYGFTMDMRPAR